MEATTTNAPTTTIRQKTAEIREHFFQRLMMHHEPNLAVHGEDGLDKREHRILWFLANVHPQPTWAALAEGTRIANEETPMVTFAIIQQMLARGTIKRVHRGNHRYGMRAVGIQMTRHGHERFAVLEGLMDAKEAKDAEDAEAS